MEREPLHGAEAEVGCKPGDVQLASAGMQAAAGLVEEEVPLPLLGRAVEARTEGVGEGARREPGQSLHLGECQWPPDICCNVITNRVDGRDPCLQSLASP